MTIVKLEKTVEIGRPEIVATKVCYTVQNVIDFVQAFADENCPGWFWKHNGDYRLDYVLTHYIVWGDGYVLIPIQEL